MSNNQISPYLQIFKKRIFFDIVADGCGSGCVYCFSKHPQNEQSFLSIDTLDMLCDRICEVPNCHEYILSFCPNTEPMKSKESRALVYHVVERLHSQFKFIQIATKEKIPIEYLDNLNSLVGTPSKIRISISLPYLEHVSLIEPYAAGVDQRLQNFYNIRLFPNLCSILYLRPFNIQMVQNQERYAEIIETYAPNEICVGAEFVPKVDSQQLCTFMYDKKLAPAIFTKPELEDVFAFAKYLREKTHRKIFFSSICNIANQSDYGCLLNLRNFDHRYCIDCEIENRRSNNGFTEEYETDPQI